MAFNVSGGTGNPKELLNWVNASLTSRFSRIEELCTGSAYCQLMHMLFPDSIDLKKVHFDAKKKEEYVTNFHLLQAALTTKSVKKTMPIDRLVTAEYKDNVKFLQWFKLFFDANYEEKEYDALTVRNGQQMGSVKQQTKNVPKEADSRGIETNPNKPQKSLYSSLLKKSDSTPTENVEKENATALPTTSDSTPDESIKLLQESVKALIRLGFSAEQITDVAEQITDGTDYQDEIKNIDVLKVVDAKNKSNHATGGVKCFGTGRFNVMDDNNNQKYLNLSAAVEFAETVGRTYGTTAPNKIMFGNIKSQLQRKTQTVFKKLNIQAESVKLIVEKSEIIEKKTPGGSIYMIIFCGALLRKFRELLSDGHPCENLKNSIQLSLEAAIKELKSLRVNKEEKEKIKKTEEVAKANLADMSNLKYNFFGNNAQSAKFLLYECVVGIENAPKKTFELEFLDEHTLNNIMMDRLEWVAVYIQLSGGDIILTSQHFDEWAIKYFQSQKLMPLTVRNKDEFYRVQRATGATPLAELKLMRTDERNFGFAEKVLIDDTEDGRSVIIETAKGTIIVEDVTFKNWKLELNEYEEDTFVPGYGKTEYRIASKLQELANKCGEDVAVGIRKFGEAVALNFEYDNVSDSVSQKYDSYLTKLWSLREACSIATTILQSTV